MVNKIWLMSQVIVIGLNRWTKWVERIIKGCYRDITLLDHYLSDKPQVVSSDYSMKNSCDPKKGFW